MINRSSSPLYKPSNATNYPPRLLNLEVEVGIIEVEVEQKKKKKKTRNARTALSSWITSSKFLSKNEVFGKVNYFSS